MVNCDHCDTQAFVKATPDLVLCKSCFSLRVEKKVRKTINQYKMLHYGAHVAVGLSGGKDSVVLLNILRKVVHHKTKITAIVVDEGIEGYRNEGVQIALDSAKKLNVQSTLSSYKEFYGIPLDNMVKKSPFGKSSCAICGTFRRKILNFVAIKINADYLATGHNLDDEAESIQLNLLRGDPIRFTRLDRFPKKVNPKFIPRIKPLVFISQPEIVYYALANKLNYHESTCPYAYQARRNFIRIFLSDQEKRHPGTLINIVRTQDQLLKLLKRVKSPFKDVYECKVCGDPTDNEGVCMSCRLLIEMDN
ncbi:MAG: TIGR00269 family protein [Candidatus Hodarchaeales archaeon]|jgi:uncharacterized protein (TIGR00269 family)